MTALLSLHWGAYLDVRFIDSSDSDFFHDSTTKKISSIAQIFEVFRNFF